MLIDLGGDYVKRGYHVQPYDLRQYDQEELEGENVFEVAFEKVLDQFEEFLDEFPDVEDYDNAEDAEVDIVDQVLVELLLVVGVEHGEHQSQDRGYRVLALLLVFADHSEQGLQYPVGGEN